jgi:microcin C transport system substrate-binding protein
MERKKDWWAKDNRFYKYRFNVDRVVFKVIRNPQIAYVHFKKGEIDYYPITRPKWWHSKARGELYDNGMLEKRWFYVTVPEGVGGFFMNFKNPLLKDANIRQGIAHSINMEGMIRDVLKGDYERKQRFTEGFEQYDNSSIKARKYDLAKAAEYFKKAGWLERDQDGILIKDGKRLSFKVNFGFEPHMPRLTYMREEAKKAGLELVLELLDPVTNYRKTSTKEHEIGWLHYGGGGLKPRYHQYFHSSYAGKPDNNNLCEVNDPTLDKMIMAYRAEFDAKKSTEQAHAIQKYIYDLCPIIYNYNVPYHRTAYWRYWKFPEIAAGKFSETLFEPFLGTGLNESGGGLFWLDQEARKKVQQEKLLGSDGKPVIIIDEEFKPGQ